MKCVDGMPSTGLLTARRHVLPQLLGMLRIPNALVLIKLLGMPCILRTNVKMVLDVAVLLFAHI